MTLEITGAEASIIDAGLVEVAANPAAEIIAERAEVPDAAELADGEPVRRGGVTCYGTAEDVPYCSGADCPEWEDCHGEKLRGVFVSASN